MSERQVAPTLDGIRPDHRHRYEWAADRLAGKYVVDAGCGVGYGSSILADRGCRVRAYDYSEDAIQYAKEHYNSKPEVEYNVGHLYDVQFPQDADAVVAFEVLEHLARPEKALRNFHDMAPMLYASVPNEEVFPFRGYTHHKRHYTKGQFAELLARNGWLVKEWWGQEGITDPVIEGVNGRTLVAVAERTDEPVPLPPEPEPDEILEQHLLNGKVPETVAIVAMGGSRLAYFQNVLEAGSRERVADEVWAINNMGGLIRCDRVFQMDDLAIQEARAKEGKRHIDGMLTWIKDGDTPVYTSRVYDGYNTLVEYPLEWIAQKFNTVYFNSTIPYAFALAVAIGAKNIQLYGCDYSYNKNAHKREKGRACLEFWIGIATQLGVRITIPHRITTLLDSDVPEAERLYGYDTEWVTLENHDGKLYVTRVPRGEEDIPSAQTMEVRYSHDPRLEAQAKPQE